MSLIQKSQIKDKMKFKKIAFLLTLAISFSSLNYFDQAFSKDIKVNDNSYFLNIERQIETSQNAKSFGDKLKLAEFYKNLGDDLKAGKLLRTLLKENKNNSLILLKLAEISDRSYYIDQSEELLKMISKNSPEYNEAISRLMKIYILKKDKEKADNLLKENPNNLLISAIYDYSVFKLDPKSAKEKFQNYLKTDPKNKDARYYLASILVDDHKLKESSELLKTIIADDYFYSASHALLGYIESIDKKESFAGVNELRIALKTNLMEIRALTSFGNGVTDKTYEELEKDSPNLKSSDNFFSQNKEIINLLNKGNKDLAEAKVNQVFAKYPQNIHSYITRANFFMNTGDYRKAIDTYRAAREISPEYGLVNNGLAIAMHLLIKSGEKKLKIFNLDLYDYSKIDMESLKKVFVNYEDLPEKYKKIIFYSIFPLKQYLPVLAASGSTHYIIPLYEKATDYKSGQEFKGQRSFDGRLWDDIRGRGGLNSATGIEDLETSTNFDFNTLSHEFAHQVHGYAFTKEQKAKISELYEKAKKENKFLDYYAGSNDFEYFAQGVEAYNSKQGKLTLKATAKNTIEFLKAKDKDLYNFIDKASNELVTQDNYSQAYLQSANDLYFQNDYINSINNYEKAVRAKPSDMNSYLLLANVYYQAGKKDKSIETYKKVLASDKNSAYAYFGLAYNYLLDGKFNEAQNNFDKGFEKDKLSSESYAEMARLFLENGNYNKSLEYIDNSFKIEPDNALAYSIKSLYYSEKFDIENAIINIDKAIQFDPGNTLYKVRKAYILAKSGATIKAYSIITDIDNMYKNSLPVRYDYDQKKNKYNYYNIKDIPTKAEYYYTLAYLKEIDKNYIEAVDNYIESIELINDYYKPKRKLLELYNSNLIDKTIKDKIKIVLKM